jgi:8-oxo-dGTP pyrophosphatase MutT (NUDIX family)
MKIFAYKLCLNVVVLGDYPFYASLSCDWAELRRQFEQGLPSEGQVWQMKITSFDSLAEEIFEFQKIEQNRNVNGEIQFLVETVEAQETLVNQLLSYFKVEIAAGGLVENENGECLFIFNRGKWSLPKGHVEKEEEISDAAVREVIEETGLISVELLHSLDSTYHTFFDERKKRPWRLKRTFWFKMFATKNQTLTPQLKENIEDVQWISKADWLTLNLPTFPQIIRLMESYWRQINLQS